jgi:hypothetical protein
MQANTYGVTAFSIPGYDTPDAFPEDETQKTEATPYAIPPVLWMLFFLFIGYIGIRFLLED